jgi:hypothetical protein
VDSYVVQISGDDLRVDSLIATLNKLSVARYHRIGEDFFLEGGVRKPRKRGGVYQDSSVEFASNCRTFLDLLAYLENKRTDIQALQIDDIIIWATMNRGEQINGELSSEEIRKLAAIGASFCWSVLNEEDQTAN